MEAQDAIKNVPFASNNILIWSALNAKSRGQVAEVQTDEKQTLAFSGVLPSSIGP